MAIPSVVGTESGGRTGTGTVTVTPPAGADYWVAFVVGPEHTPPSGWSLVQSWAVEGEPVYWFYESTGAPGAVWTYSTGLSVNDPVAVLVRGYSGVSGTAYASQHTATSPSLNATEDALAARVVFDLNDSTSPLGYPTGATLNRAQVSQPDGTNTWAVSIGIAEQEVTAGATGTAAWAVPGQWEPHALTILLYGETDPPTPSPTDVTAVGGDHELTGGFTADPAATQFRGQWRRTDLVRPSTTTQAGAPDHLRRISQENLPLPSGYTYDFTGDGVPYCQFDSGCRVTHNEFGGRYVTGGSIAGPWNTDTAPNPPFSQGHGTGVAAMALGTTYGVAKDAILYSVNSGDEAGPTMEQYEDSAAWLIANKPANRTVALNISNGFPLDDIPRLEAFFDSLYLNGIAVFVAAGNTNDEQPYNAFQYRFFVVGASTPADVKASYSDYGDGIDLYAPISPTTTAGSSSNSATRTADGTSEASPTAAGVALKILEGNPELSPWRLYEVLRSQAFVGKISGIPTGTNRLLNGNANTDEWSDFPVDGDTYVLDGLDAGASYEVRFGQMVGGEWSDYSSPVGATTDDASSPGAITTLAGEATAGGGVSTFVGGQSAVISTVAGEATAGGGVSTFSGAQSGTISTVAGEATAGGGVSTFSGAASAVIDTVAGGAVAEGGVSTFAGGAASTLTTLPGEATAGGGSSLFRVEGVFATTAGEAVADGGTAYFVGTQNAFFTTLAGSAVASGTSSIFLVDGLPPDKPEVPMSTLGLAELEIAYLRAASGATDDLSLADLRMLVYGADERAYFALLSGLTPEEAYSLADHMLAFYRGETGLSDVSLVDAARAYWVQELAP